MAKNKDAAQVVIIRVGCEHEGRYPQVDPYQSDINDDHGLWLMCDDCADESAADI